MPRPESLSPCRHILIEILPMLGILVKKLPDLYTVRVEKWGFVLRLDGKLMEASFPHILRQYSSDGEEEVIAGPEV